MKRLPVRLTAAMLIGLLVPLSASAEPEFTGSRPADGATLSTAPSQLTLEFAEPVTLSAVIVHESDGDSHAIATLPTERSAQFVVDAPDLEPGSYRIEWRALDDTIHLTSGEFSFEIE